MSLLAVPPELILQVADNVTAEKDLSSLARTCHSLHDIANPRLYRRNPRALFWAAEHGGDDTARRCLSYGADINARNGDGLTPVAIAAVKDDDSVVKILLAQPGADPNGSILNGRTLLSLAADKNSTSVVKLLLARHDVDVDTPDDLGATPLWYAAWCGRPSTVRLLLATGKANVNTVAMPPPFYAEGEDEEEFYENFTVPMSICYAAFQKLELKFDEDLWGYLPFLPDEGSKREREKAIALLLGEPDLLFPQWQDLLSHTAHHGPAEIARLLIERPEAREQLRRDVNGTSRLFHWASMGGQAGVVELLVDFGVDVDRRGERGRTALSVAAEYTSQPRLLRRLIESGAELESEDDDGCTPLYYAIWSGTRGNVEELTLHGAELSRVNQDQMAGLVRHAAEQGHVATLQYLLDMGVDLNITYHSGGRTPLAYAAIHRRAEAAAWLAQQEGIDVNYQDNGEGFTALHSAIEHGALNVVLMLLSDRRTDVNVKDYSGLTPVAFSAARLVRMYAEWDGPFGHWVPRDNRPSVPSEAITEALLSRPDAVIELGDAGSLALDGLFVPAAQKASTRILKLLLGRWKEHLHITEERVGKVAAVGTRDSLRLLVQDAHIELTDSILEAAVRNKGNGTAILKLLLEHRQRALPQWLPIIAASTGEPSTMELLLGVEGRSPRVTPEHLAAAAANKSHGKEMLSLLLAQREEAQVTAEVVHAALRNKKDPGEHHGAIVRHPGRRLSTHG